VVVRSVSGMSTPTPSLSPVPAEGGRHPVLAAAETVRAAVKDVRDVDPAFMSVAEKREALAQLVAARDEMEALYLSVLAAAGEVAEEDGAKDAAAWLASRLRVDRPAASASLRLAEALERRWHVLAGAVRDGRVSIAQARVVARCLDDLARAGDVPAEVLTKAEAELVRLAAEHPPGDLRRLGERITTLVAPQLGEERDRKALERAEREASAATRLSMRRRGDGSTDLTARIPDQVAARLGTFLDAYTSPRTGDGPAHRDRATGQVLPRDRMLGEAFCSLVEAIPSTAMPLHGGSATTVVVTVDLDTLREGVGSATVDDGTRITAAQARRLACQAGVVPAVLGGESQPLDLGRTRRLFTSTQRTALTLRQPTCRAEGCEVPASWCEAHHATQPWSQGGTTNLADGMLLCPWHHHRAHDPTYATDRCPDGSLRFHRRT
jgi:hypothetical protein